MGILSWFSKGKNNPPKKEEVAPASKSEAAEAPGMNGAVEVRRPDVPAADISVFEFGSVAASADKVTLAGYCPVSDELEPCRWEILPAGGSDAPQFRVSSYIYVLKKGSLAERLFFINGITGMLITEMSSVVN